MLKYIKPSFATLAVFVTFGVLVHDMHIDRMATVAASVPMALATYGLVDNMLKKSDHTHIDRAAFPKNFTMPGRSSSLPDFQSRDKDRRYIQNKKVFISGGGELNSLWPST